MENLGAKQIGVYENEVRSRGHGELVKGLSLWSFKQESNKIRISFLKARSGC